MVIAIILQGPDALHIAPGGSLKEVNIQPRIEVGSSADSTMSAAHHHLRQDLFNAREKRKIGPIGQHRQYPGEVVNVTRTVFQAVYIGHLSRSQHGLRSNHQFRQARNVVKINRQR
jgi:hypothetical protein